MSVLGLDYEYIVKYTLCLQELGFALTNSFRQKVIFGLISLVSSQYGYNIRTKWTGFDCLWTGLLRRQIGSIRTRLKPVRQRIKPEYQRIKPVCRRIKPVYLVLMFSLSCPSVFLMCQFSLVSSLHV